MADLTLTKVLKNTKYDILTPNGFQHFDALLCGINTTITLTFSNGNMLECTPKHKICIDNNNHVFAKDLNIGDFVQSENNSKTKVANIKENNSVTTVYDFLNVNDCHKYYVNKVLTKNCLYIDEFAFVKPHIADEFMASVFPTISSGKTTKVIITSTPAGMNQFFTLWEDALGDYSETTEGNGYVRSEIPWDAVPGRDAEWAKKQIRMIGEIRFNQEFLCKFIGSVSTLIDHHHLETMKPTKPIQIPRLPNFIKIWQLPVPKGKLEAKNWEYVASLDSGYGVHADNTVLQIFLVKSNITAHQVAKMSSNSTDIELFCKKANMLLKKYYNPGLIIEQNGPGLAATKFFHITAEYENLLHFDPKGNHMGMWATDKLKEHACILLKTYVQRNFLKIYDRDTINELHAFGRLTQKKWGGLGGNHDDHVTALYWIPYYLQSPLFYGNIVEVNMKSFAEDDFALMTEQERNDQDHVMGNLENPKFHQEELAKGAEFLPEELKAPIADDEEFQGGTLFFRR